MAFVPKHMIAETLAKKRMAQKLAPGGTKDEAPKEVAAPTTEEVPDTETVEAAPAGEGDLRAKATQMTELIGDGMLDAIKKKRAKRQFIQ